jgi:hypothetical protein
MAVFSAMMEERMALQPPIVLPSPPRSSPFDPLRRLNDGPQEPLAEGGPVMAESRDLWWPIRGRRLMLRLHRPFPARTCRFWSICMAAAGSGAASTPMTGHAQLCRRGRLRCAGRGLRPLAEAVFPQALEECAAVLRHLGEAGAAASAWMHGASSWAATAPARTWRQPSPCSTPRRPVPCRCAACCSTTASSTTTWAPPAIASSPRATA